MLKKDLKSEEARRQEIEKAIKLARESYRRKSIAEAREPVLRLQDRFDVLGLDRLELLYAAETSLPGDDFWLNSIVEILARKSALSTRELPYLLRRAIQASTNLNLWQRIFREPQLAENPALCDKAREECALALLSCFPTPEKSRWNEPGREGEARSLLTRSLDEALVRIMQANREDPAARTLLAAGCDYFPARVDVLRRMADLIVKSASVDSRSLSIVLKALMHTPGNLRYATWAAKGLLRVPGHYGEGIEMLRGLHWEHPNDPMVLEELVHALKEGEQVTAADAPILAKWVKASPDDVRALEMLADYHAAHESIEPEALRIYKMAAARSTKRRNYLRLIGHEAAARNDWSEVMESFNEILASGQESEDVILPLATACAEFQRVDEEAIAIYRKAIRLGSRKVEVHSMYCRYLFLTSRHEPSSVTQFIQSASVCPECAWAQTGLIAHYLETGDPERALDGAIQLLEKIPGEVEVAKLAARALAADYSRKQLARLSRLQPGTLRRVFEEAHVLQPDAGLIATGLARQRLADGVRDEESLRLLGDVCRKNPDATDLRLARADLLWDLGKLEVAVEVYRDLLERLRSGPATGQISRVLTPQVRTRVLMRIAEQLMKPPGPSGEDIDVLLEAVAEPSASVELVLGVARLIVDSRIDHPKKLPLLERALTYAAGDVKLERAVAECQASLGNPRPAVALAVRLLQQGVDDEETVNLLRSTLSAGTRGRLKPETVSELRRALDLGTHSPQLLLAASELLAATGPPSREDLPLLEKLAKVFPRNLRVSKRLAKGLNMTGQSESAAEVYESLSDHVSHDDELALELAKTNARLGRNTRDCRKAAMRAVELEPDNIELLFHLAAIELAMGQLPTAVKHLDHVLEKQPDMHPRVLAMLDHSEAVKTDRGELNLLLARVHIKAGHLDKALVVLARLQANYQRHFGPLMNCYHDIIESGPDNPRPYIERAILQRISGHLPEAVEDMSSAHQLAPDNLDIIAEYTDLLTQKLQSTSPPDIETAIKCGEFYRLLGDESASFEMAELVLEQDPENQRALELVCRLQLHAGALHNCWRTLAKLKKKEVVLELYQALARGFAEQDDHLHAADVLTDAIEIAGPKRELLEQLRELHQTQAKAAEGAAIRQKVLGMLSSRAQSRYELHEELGSGAMGAVYKAYDRELDEIVVLKILPENFAKDADALTRFRNEAKAARKLAHPNIVRIHDIGEDGGRKHISMEYVAGGDLMRHLKLSGGKLTLAESIRIVQEIARALAHAHSEGVLHRDIKTANILLTPASKVKLSDFGIASLIEAGLNDLDPAGTTTVSGTPLYMSPEQFDGAQLTPASDLYSLGVLWYELLSGMPPFVKGSISYHHQFTIPVKLENVPGEMWTIISRLLTKEPVGRYQTATDLLQALDAFQGRVAPRGPHDTQKTR